MSTAIGTPSPPFIVFLFLGLRSASHEETSSSSIQGGARGRTGVAVEVGVGVLLKKGVDARFLLETSLPGPRKKYKDDHNRMGEYKHNTIQITTLPFGGRVGLYFCQKLIQSRIPAVHGRTCLTHSMRCVTNWRLRAVAAKTRKANSKSKAHNCMKKCRQRKAITGVVPSLRKFYNVSHDKLGLDVKEVEQKLSTAIFIRLNDEGFASTVADI